MSESGEGVVLGAEDNRQRSRTELRAQRRVETEVRRFDGEASRCHGFANPSGRLTFLPGDLGIRVNSMTQAQQVIGARRDGCGDGRAHCVGSRRGHRSSPGTP